ncbi:urea transporter [Reticulibacter mediterranei]|uniref:Urea transporter n=1 Tax=Reticulibacter mediterranei TaxID=2778369 RepID=A0A8J3IYR3_9CHLR|nr:urea transporter [Reticulibacter mediterranei]GHP00956.1 urea transporter [Reticulibacter mediterranei]
MAIDTTLEHLTSPWDHLAQENPLVGFLDTLLRGCGQVMFQNNPLTGLLFLIGIFINSALLGVAGLIGLVVSTVTALLLGADRSLIRAGLFGYNGILVGIGLAFFVHWNAFLVVYIILAAFLSAVVMMGLLNLMGGRDIPALTAPFVISAWLFLFGVYLFHHLPPSAAIAPTLLNPNAVVQTDLRPLPTGLAGAGITILNLVEAFFRGIGEVFFQDNLATGVIFLIAILVNSRISALFAALGSLVGLLTALFLFGGNGYWVYHGLYGFNAVLCGIALGGLFYVFTWESTLYALLCMIVSTVVMASISVALSPLGMPALTAPFVLTAWLFIWPRGGFHVLHPVALADVTSAEHIRHDFLAREHAVGVGRTVQPAP